MSKSAKPEWRIVASALPVLALVAAMSAQAGQETRSKEHRVPPTRPHATPVYVVNDERSLMPVRQVGPAEVIAPMFRPKDLLIRSLELTAEGPNGASVSLPAVQDWLILEIDLLPRPPASLQGKSAQACEASALLPLDEVNSGTSLPAIMSASWSGQDFRSFNRPLPFLLKRRTGETIEFFLQALAADGSCRATMIVRGVTP